MRRIGLLGGALLLLAACGGGNPGGGGTAGALGTIKVGAIFPTTGSVASSGVDSLDGVRLAVDVLNGRYPRIDLPRLSVGKIDLVEADSQGDAQTGSAAVDRLVNSDGVVALTGAFQSAVTITVAQRAERLGIPLVNGSSSSTALTEQGLKWFWRVGPSDRTFGETYYRFLQAEASQHPIRKMVVIHENDQFGNDGARVLGQLAPAAGIQLTDIQYPFNATDMTPQIQNMRQAQPDAVFVFAFINDLTLMYKTMAQLGYTPPILFGFGAGYVDPKFVPNLGAKTEGAVTRAAWSLEVTQKNATARAVADAFKSKYGQDMTENSARDFEAMMTLGIAIQSAGSTDPAKIQTALNRTNRTRTIMGWPGIKFGSDGQNSLAEGIIEQMQGGAYRVLYPPNVASAKVVWPIQPLSSR
jgi:branched-chain amino acid transport system substrate-binding protein